jgi:hypothetical protein
MVADVFDTSVLAGFCKSEAVAIVYVAVLHEMVLIAHGAGLDQEECTKFVRQHFQEMEDRKKELMEARR